MSLSVANISMQVERLPRKSQQKLFKWMIGKAEEISEKEAERLWIAELKRRYKNFLTGKLRFESSEKVFKELERPSKR